jgi:hypothetical protein
MTLAKASVTSFASSLTVSSSRSASTVASSNTNTRLGSYNGPFPTFLVPFGRGLVGPGISGLTTITLGEPSSGMCSSSEVNSDRNASRGSWLIFARISSKWHSLTVSTVHNVYSISWSDGSGGSSLAKLDTYDVNAEKMPVSAGLSARSMIWAGFCRGMGGRARVFWKDKK